MINMCQRALLLVLANLAILGCQVNGIPLKDQAGTRIRNIWLHQNKSGIEMSLATLPDNVEVLNIAMNLPDNNISLEIFAQSDVLIASKTIPVPLGVRPGQGTLEFQFRPPAGAVKIRLADEANAELPQVLSLSVHNEYSGLILDDYRIVLPETMRYRQEIRSPLLANTGEPVVYQDIYLDGILSNFNYQEYIPILELEYEYTRPVEGMPLEPDHDHDHDFAQTLPPLAKIEFLSTDLELVRSWDLRLRPGRQKVYFYPQMFSVQPASVRFTHNSIYGRVRGFRLIRRKATVARVAELEPLPIDLGNLMEYSSALWRHEQFEFFRWNLFPAVHIFDFADYEVQARFFKRLAYYVEKEGFRGSILSNASLEQRHGWNAHNYHPRDLSRFYNQVEADGLELNAEELLLRELLLENGILLRNGGSYGEGEGQILSVTSHPLQNRASRLLFLNHESLHGVFYNFPELRELSTSLWTNMAPDSKEYLSQYLAYVGYDRGDSYLMVNEFQAYLLQQELSDLKWIVQNRMSARIAARTPKLKGFLDRVKQQAASDALRSAETLQMLLYQEKGLIAGDLLCLIEN